MRKQNSADFYLFPEFYLILGGIVNKMRWGKKNLSVIRSRKKGIRSQKT